MTSNFVRLKSIVETLLVKGTVKERKEEVVTISRTSVSDRQRQQR